MPPSFQGESPGFTGYAYDIPGTVKVGITSRMKSPEQDTPYCDNIPNLTSSGTGLGFTSSPVPGSLNGFLQT